MLAKICVSRTGSVDSVTILQGADPLLDGNVVSAVKNWRYRPLMADNQRRAILLFRQVRIQIELTVA